MWGFDSFKDLLEVVAVPLAVAVIAAVWPRWQSRQRSRRFEGLIFRELEEAGPHPLKPRPGGHWWDHQSKRFVHQRIFENPGENIEFVLSLDPQLVYLVSQLWDAMRDHNEDQWRYYFGQIVEQYGRDYSVQAPFEQWNSLIDRYTGRSSERS